MRSQAVLPLTVLALTLVSCAGTTPPIAGPPITPTAPQPSGASFTGTMWNNPNGPGEVVAIAEDANGVPGVIGRGTISGTTLNMTLDTGATLDKYVVTPLSELTDCDDATASGVKPEPIGTRVIMLTGLVANSPRQGQDDARAVLLQGDINFARYPYERTGSIELRIYSPVDATLRGSCKIGQLSFSANVNLKAGWNTVLYMGVTVTKELWLGTLEPARNGAWYYYSVAP
ncbi:MAG TPA: hypothetical protein VNT60_10100 [Deinococcales bacterium]|nr:hypothetical protein [Deinococcales bacterium]